MVARLHKSLCWLLADIHSGNAVWINAAWSELQADHLAAFWPRAMRRCVEDEREDCWQDVCAYVFNRIRAMDGVELGADYGGHLCNWVAGGVSEYFRRRNAVSRGGGDRGMSMDEEAVCHLPGRERSPVAQAEQSEATAYARRLIKAANLTDAEAACLALVQFQGMAYADAAMALGKDAKHVDNAITRAKGKIRKAAGNC